MTQPPRRLTLALAATGSMGDVRPLLLLAQALRRAGHEVRVLAPPQYETLAAELGLEDFRPVWLEREAMIEAQARANDECRNHLDAAYFDSWFASFPTIREACRGADALVARYAAFEGFARLEGLPFFHAANVPPLERPGRALPRVVAGSDVVRLAAWQGRAAALPGGGGLVNLATHLHRLALSPLDAWRARAGLKVLAGVPRRQQQALRALAATPEERARLNGRRAAPPIRLYGLSTRLLPAQGGIYTGLWHGEPPADFVPPPALEAFLAAGEVPLLVTFGSNPCTRKGRDFAWISKNVAAAVERVGCRVLLQAGWGGLRWPEERGPPPPGRVLEIGDLPHEWLLGRVAAVLHHGGAGTSLEALRQGLPSVVVPFVNDQFFWAWRLYSLGVAPPPFEADAMTPEALAAALQAALHDPALRARATALGEALRAEPGLARAVEVIEHEVAAAGRLSSASS